MGGHPIVSAFPKPGCMREGAVPKLSSLSLAPVYRRGKEKVRAGGVRACMAFGAAEHLKMPPPGYCVPTPHMKAPVLGCVPV